MKSEIKRGVEIAESYRNNHDGEIPVLVVADLPDGKEQIIVGTFRKKHEVQDQKMFCSVLRMMFALHGVKSYQLLVKPVFNYTAAQMTKNVLAIVSIGNSDSDIAEFFEIADEELISYKEEMPVEGMFTLLLPSEVERENIISVSAKTKKSINDYIAACTYTLPVESSYVAGQTGLEALLQSMSN